MPDIPRSALVITLLAVAACMDAGPDTGRGETALANKATICHVPPGNPGDAHTIQVAAAAVNAHVGHGDYLGICVQACVGEGAACTLDSQCCLGACAAGTCHAACQPGTTELCYTGPSPNAGVGACAWGEATCNLQGTDYGACAGDVHPVNEICDDGLDNDCDGHNDDGCPQDVTGRLWQDTNVDGTTLDELGDPEPAFAGAIGIELHDATGAFVTAVVEVDGTYVFKGVAPGRYRLYVQLDPDQFWSPVLSPLGTDETIDSDFSNESTWSTEFEVGVGGGAVTMNFGFVTQT